MAQTRAGDACGFGREPYGYRSRDEQRGARQKQLIGGEHDGLSLDELGDCPNRLLVTHPILDQVVDCALVVAHDSNQFGLVTCGVVFPDSICNGRAKCA